MLTLYATPASIYCAKVRLALAMKNMAVVEVTPPGGYRSSAYKAIVPQGTIPAIDHDGFILWESDAIIEYLDDVSPEVPLLPSDIRLRAKARAMSRLLDIRVEPAVRSLFPLVGSGERDVRSDELDAALGILELQADPRPLLSGAAPSLPDCGCLPLFCVIDLLERELSLDLPWPRWAKTYRAAAAGMAEVGKVLADYRRALDDWASSRKAGVA